MGFGNDHHGPLQQQGLQSSGSESLIETGSRENGQRGINENQNKHLSLTVHVLFKEFSMD